MRQPVVKNKQRRWYRLDNGYLAGVCEGLGQSFALDPNFLRLVFLFSLFFSFGTGMIFYLILAFVLPKSNEMHSYQQKKVLGVCFKISQRFGWDLGLIRTLWVCAFLFSAGAVGIIYLLALFLVPEPVENLS